MGGIKVIKINKLEIENVKRVKAITLEPAENGLTVIGGKNNQGKTSVLDSIAWVLGGDRFRPGNAQREDSVNPPRLCVTLSNGLIVERKGKNSDLKITDPTGNKAGQNLLNAFIEQLALNLPKFMESTGAEKAKTLLRIIGIGDKLAELEAAESRLYNERLTIGRIADQKYKFAEEMTYYPDAPKEPISITELIFRQQEILAKNGENQRMRNDFQNLNLRYANIKNRIETLEEELRQLMSERDSVAESIEISSKTVAELQDESIAEVEESIRDIEKINIKVRANLDREKAQSEASEYRIQYDNFTTQIEDIRTQKIQLLDGAELPLPGLSVDNGELTYNGKKWDCMSGSEQLRVSTAIIRKLNPECGFVLIDKLEQMDIDTMREFGDWLTAEGLQAIATRVSTGDECSIIIEDGYSTVNTASNTADKKWKEGEF